MKAVKKFFKDTHKHSTPKYKALFLFPTRSVKLKKDLFLKMCKESYWNVVSIKTKNSNHVNQNLKETRGNHSHSNFECFYFWAEWREWKQKQNTKKKSSFKVRRLKSFILRTKNSRMTSLSSVINCKSSFYRFGNSGRNYVEQFAFRIITEDLQKDVDKRFIKLVIFYFSCFSLYCFVLLASALMLNFFKKSVLYH